MNKKVKTITSWLAAAIFLLALAINIKVTLDDPFVMLSDEAIAQTTTDDESGTGGSGTTTGTSNGFYSKERCWERGTYRIVSISGTIGGGLSFDAGDILGSQLEADAGCSVSYEAVDQYEITCPATTEPQTVECQTRGWELCSGNGCPCSEINS